VLFLNIFVSSLFHVVDVVFPVFVFLFFGWWLKYTKQITKPFIDQASSIVFSYALPSLLFISVYNSPSWGQEHFSLAVMSAVLCLLLFVLACLVAIFSVKERGDRGVFVQGAFRSNLGVIGIALCSQLYQSEGVVFAAIVLAVVTPLYNILSITVLSFYANNKALNVQSLTLGVIKNPLIVAIAAAFFLKGVGISLGDLVLNPLNILSSLSLPLALMCIGATLALPSNNTQAATLAIAVSFKLILVPIIVFLIALLAGLDGVLLGVLLIMFASPTATASYVMARNVGANKVLAANLITVSTVISIFSLSLLVLYLG
jgi:predicted permease